MSTYRELFDLTEKAIFQNQARNSYEVMRFIRHNSSTKNLNKTEIEKIIHKVATQYK